jgi:rod shape-determining protein MreB and related proteins
LSILWAFEAFGLAFGGRVGYTASVFEQLMNLIGYDIGVDLGTANTVVLVRGRGVLIRQPSVVARHAKTKEILAIGEEAKRMTGKNPANIEVVRPLRDGSDC